MLRGLAVGEWGAYFGAGAHYAEDGVAGDHADDVGAGAFVVVAVVVFAGADYWHLIDVGGEQALEQA